MKSLVQRFLTLQVYGDFVDQQSDPEIFKLWTWHVTATIEQEPNKNTAAMQEDVYPNVTNFFHCCIVEQINKLHALISSIVILHNFS